MHDLSTIKYIGSCKSVSISRSNREKQNKSKFEESVEKDGHYHVENARWKLGVRRGVYKDYVM